MEPEGSSPCLQQPANPEPPVTFRNNLILYGEELLAPGPTHGPEDHSCDCLFNIFGGRLLQPQPKDPPPTPSNTRILNVVFMLRVDGHYA